MLVTHETVIDRQLTLLDAGLSEDEIRKLLGTVRTLHKGNPRIRKNPGTSPEITSAALSLTMDHHKSDPKIKGLIQSFANLYHQYFAQWEAVFQANNFETQMKEILHDIPESEVHDMVIKVTSLTSNLSIEMSALVYKDIKYLVQDEKIPRRTARVFHNIIDKFIDRHCKSSNAFYANSLEAWAILDKMRKEAIGNLQSIRVSNIKGLSPESAEVYKNMQLVFEGIRNRDIAAVRHGLSYPAIKDSNQGVVYDNILSEIELIRH